MNQAEAESAARDNYDRMAEVYWNHVAQETTAPSLALTGLEFFADLVQKSGPGLVADVGCGPGHITAFLAGLGLDVFGVDISPGLLDIARGEHPGIRFELGQLASLPMEDESLLAVVSKHSLIHTPADVVPTVLNEFARVLSPGGSLFLSFFGADDPSNHGKGFDHAVTTAYSFDVDAMAALLPDAGFVEKVRMVRQPGQNERQLPGVILLARLAERTVD